MPWTYFEHFDYLKDKHLLTVGRWDRNKGLMTKRLLYVQPYISSHVKDIHDVLEITVYDEDKDHKYEFLGKGWLISESILISVGDFQLHIYKPNDFSTTFKI